MHWKVKKSDTNRSCFMVEIVLNSLWHLGPDADTKNCFFFFSPSFHSRKFIAQLIYLLGQFLFYYCKSSNIFCIILSSLWFLHFALFFFFLLFCGLDQNRKILMSQWDQLGKLFQHPNISKLKSKKCSWGFEKYVRFKTAAETLRIKDRHYDQLPWKVHFSQSSWLNHNVTNGSCELVAYDNYNVLVRNFNFQMCLFSNY